MNDKLIIGALELVDLPELGIQGLQARVDTGAKTSSLHADDIRMVRKQGKPFIEFVLRTDLFDVGQSKHCIAPLCDIRKIKSSNGESEERYIVETILAIGGRKWPIEVSLTDRSGMSNLMLIGRTSMQNVLVDPNQTYLMAD